MTHEEREARAEAAEAELELYKNMYMEAARGKCEAEARAEELEAERDAAVEALNKLIPLCCEAGVCACGFCISNGEDCHGDDPSWRGLEGGERDG